MYISLRANIHSLIASRMQRCSHSDLIQYWLYSTICKVASCAWPIMKVDCMLHMATCTVYPKKYAHGFCFAVLCCGYTLTDFPISIRLTSLALWQSNDCPSACKATLMNMDKYFMWIHYEWLHNHNKAKHNKTVCIFLGIYCTVPSCAQPIIKVDCMPHCMAEKLNRRPYIELTKDAHSSHATCSWLFLENIDHLSTGLMACSFMLINCFCNWNSSGNILTHNLLWL